MRISLFDDKADAERYVPEVQAAVDAFPEVARTALGLSGTGKIDISVFPRNGRWAVLRPVEPAVLRGDVADYAEPVEPVI